MGSFLGQRDGRGVCATGQSLVERLGYEMKTKACDSWEGEEAICRNQISLSRMAWPWALLFLPRCAVLLGACSLLLSVLLLSPSLIRETGPGVAFVQEGGGFKTAIPWWRVSGPHMSEKYRYVFSPLEEDFRGGLWRSPGAEARPGAERRKYRHFIGLSGPLGGSNAAGASPVVDETINWVAGMALGCVPS